MEYVSVCMLLYSPNKTYKQIIAEHTRSESKTFKGFNDISCFPAIFVCVFVDFLKNQKLSQENSMLICLI